MLSRYFVSFNFAALITFGLFFAMQMLIKNGEVVLTEDNIRPIVVLDKVRDPEDPPDRIEPPELLEIVDPPDIPMITFEQTDNGTGPVVFNDPGIGVDPRSIPVDTGFKIMNGKHIPIVKPAPQYPIRMLEKGIEGYVKVQFDVTVRGDTENVIAVESSHSGFERNAVKAAQKFKFKPEVVDGEPVRVTGVFNRIEFRLEN